MKLSEHLVQLSNSYFHYEDVVNILKEEARQGRRHCYFQSTLPFDIIGRLKEEGLYHEMVYNKGLVISLITW